MDAQINDIVIKTLFSAEGQFKHSYRATYPHHVGGSACFEILGFDIMLDDQLKPWLIEVNMSPSFSCGSALDAEIKHGVLRHAMRMLNLTPNVLTQARKASKMQLRKNAFRVHRKKNEINGKVSGVM
jgi:tubulin polyglutamylase TTLL6/13